MVVETVERRILSLAGAAFWSCVTKGEYFSSPNVEVVL